MYDPISVDTALVSVNGDLLISLTDGNIINAGKVRGAQGIQGERGLIGERGEPGRDGVDGAQWHTGVGMPELSLGTAGDLYMDVANSLLPIYQKVGNDWLLLCNLKVPPSGGGGGAGGAAGGGGSIIIYPKPDGGAPPTNDNDGKPIDKGDIWLDTNTGWLWVYDGSVWLPVGDRPPVSISPNPPLWNASGDTDNRYPIVEGSLWFDSDQAALYVAAKNSSDDLVWVITTPADRSVLDGVVEITFRFPGRINDRAPIHGETVYNSTTELWYAYNAPKNQWIDLPPDSERILHTKLYLDPALDDTSTTAPYEAFVNTDDDETTTRLTVNRIDINDADWSIIFKEIRIGTELSLMQLYKEYDPVDPTVILSETLNISRYQVTELTLLPDADTADTINMGVVFLDQDVDLPHQFNDDVWFILNVSLNKFVKKSGDTMTGTLEIANEGDTTDVDFDPDKANLTFTTTKTDGSASTSVSIHQNGFNSSIGITGGVVADGSYYSQSGRFYGANPTGPYFNAWYSHIRLEELQGTLQWNESIRVQWNKLEGALQWDDSARVQWNEFNVEIPKPIADDQLGDGLIIRGTTANGYETTDVDDQDGKLLAVYHNADTADAINYKGKIFAESNLVNKGYVDEKDELLRQDIIELEEEIDAIAPSLEYGQWEWEQPTSNLRAPGKGTFYLLDSAGQLTTEYKDSITVVINNYEYDDPSDSDPVDIHTWADADPGELIQLFDAADPDFMLGKIIAVNPDVETGGSSGTLEFVRIQFDLIQSSGVPNDNADPVTGKFLTRVNIFKEPSGGTASDFVLKSGDTMTGDLTIDRSDNGPTSGGTAGKEAALILKGDRTGTTNAVATIKWDNAASSYPGYLTYRSGDSSEQFFKFNQDVQFNTKNLSEIDSISLKNKLQKEGSDRITFQSGSGDAGKGTIIIHRPGNLQRGFTIKGKIAGSSNTAGDVFYHYANSGGGGDSVDYTGICTSANHIMNRSQADGRYVQTGTAGIKITKSNGNYYIQG